MYNNEIINDLREVEKLIDNNIKINQIMIVILYIIVLSLIICYFTGRI
jgi:hypothetical protein